MKRSRLLVLPTLTGLLSGCSSLEGKTSPASSGPERSPRDHNASPRPNDPFFERRYYFETMHVLEAWSLTTGNPSCVIGVLDKGFDLKHPDLRANLLAGYQAEGMEHPDTWLGRNHGTAVAGVIAARSNNGIGIAGLAPGCRILPAAYGTHRWLHEKVPESSQKWNKLVGEKQAEAMRWLVDRGCRVINCSFTPMPPMRAAFEYAIAHDVVVVVASGNFNSERPSWPAGVLDVLCVGGVDRQDRRWVAEPTEVERRPGEKRTITQGSDYGKGLNVVAPMRGFATCAPVDERYDRRLKDDQWKQTSCRKAVRGYVQEEHGGTSLAAPMATGLVGLIRSLRPDLDYKQVIRIVEQGADDLGDKGWDKFTGWGRINFARSLELAQSWPRKN